MIDHDHFRSLAAPYALGIASGAERREFEPHLAACDECRAEVAEIRRLGEAIGRSAPVAAPPAALRQRIIAAADSDRSAQQPITRESSSRSTLPWWLAAAASIAAIVAAAQWRSASNELAELRAELASTQERLASAESLRASAERITAETSARLGILASADAVSIPLAGQAVSPNAAGRVVWSRSRGLVFTASNLPALPAGRVYQLWAVAAPAPVGLALVTPGVAGEADATTTLPGGVEPTAFALTIEPEGGSPGPTGAMYLVGAR